MDKYAIFEAWAPAAGPWSPWVKPAPFAHLPRELPEPSATPEPVFDLGWLRPIHPHCAVVADLPGAETVFFALQLAALGWQPVSLLIACPVPARAIPVRSAVTAEALLAALAANAPRLAALPLPPLAPPVFMTDAGRMAPGVTIQPGMNDNRSVVFACDFPSAKVLARQGVSRVIVVRNPAVPMERDLVYALAPWQKAGLPIESRSPAGEMIAATWPRTDWLTETFYRFGKLLTLRRNPQGGFGRLVLESSGG
jgi:hypothetical protein